MARDGERAVLPMMIGEWFAPMQTDRAMDVHLQLLADAATEALANKAAFEQHVARTVPHRPTTRG